MENNTSSPKSPMVSMNGSMVIKRTKGPNGAIYLRIPRELQTEIGWGKCDCSYCKKHPEIPPKWDTLVVPAKRPKKGNDYAWTVHMPEII